MNGKAALIMVGVIGAMSPGKSLALKGCSNVIVISPKEQDTLQETGRVLISLPYLMPAWVVTSSTKKGNRKERREYTQDKYRSRQYKSKCKN